MKVFQGVEGQGNPNFTVTFVIQGNEFPVDVNPNQKIQGAVAKALAQSGSGGNPNEWQLRTEDGKQLDMGKSFEEEGIRKPTKLFLSKGPGRGGQFYPY